MSSPKIFSANFWARYQMNFKNRLKWFIKTPRTGLQILAESKLLMLALSNMTKKDSQDYFMTYEFTKIFFISNLYRRS